MEIIDLTSDFPRGSIVYAKPAMLKHSAHGKQRQSQQKSRGPGRLMIEGESSRSEEDEQAQSDRHGHRKEQPPKDVKKDDFASSSGYISLSRTSDGIPNDNSVGLSMQQDKSTSYNEFTHQFSLHSSSGDSQVSIEDDFLMTYTSSHASLSAWISELPESCTLGFDTEGNGAVTQLCCLITHRVLVFAYPQEASLLVRKSCSAVLSSLLANANYLKVGVAAFDDAVKLTRGFGVKCRGIFDLPYLSRDLQITKQGEMSRRFLNERRQGVVVIDEVKCHKLPGGLKSLFADLFQSRFATIRPMSMGDLYCSPASDDHEPGSKWQTYPFPLCDLQYAAKDAIFGVLLYNIMIRKFSEAEVRDLKAQAETELERRVARAIAKARNYPSSKADSRQSPSQHAPKHVSRTTKTGKLNLKSAKHKTKPWKKGLNEQPCIQLRQLQSLDTSTTKLIDKFPTIRHAEVQSKENKSIMERKPPSKGWQVAINQAQDSFRAKLTAKRRLGGMDARKVASRHVTNQISSASVSGKIPLAVPGRMMIGEIEQRC